MKKTLLILLLLLTASCAYYPYAGGYNYYQYPYYYGNYGNQVMAMVITHPLDLATVTAEAIMAVILLMDGIMVGVIRLMVDIMARWLWRGLSWRRVWRLSRWSSIKMAI